jgi:hypothetical protein
MTQCGGTRPIVVTEDRILKTFRIIGSSAALCTLATFAALTPTAALADGPQARSPGDVEVGGAGK